MRLLTSAVALLGMMVSPSVLAEDISVFQRDLYERITIDNAMQGKIISQNQAIFIPYADIENQSAMSDALSQSRLIQSWELSGSNLHLKFNQSVTDTRSFRIGDKIFLDIFFDADQLAAIEKTPQENTTVEPETVAQPSPVEETTNVVTEDNVETVEDVKETTQVDAEKVVEDTHHDIAEDAHEELPIAVTDEAVIVEDDVPELSDADIKPALATDTIVTINSTSPFSMAAFVRHNRLFVVTDQSDMAIPPQLSGNGQKLGWAMTEVPMDKGRAWMMPLPDNAYIRPEGRGLIWRFIISDIDPQLDSASIRRRVYDPANPAIDLMVPGVSELLRLRDPDYGDDLAVATVKRATYRMAKSYDFVDFDIMPAIVGAVVKPEADGVRLASSSQIITVTKTPKLSIASDNQDSIIQAYLQNMEDEIAQGETSTSLERVFFFSNWKGDTPPQNFYERREDLDSFLSQASADEKLGILMNMAKFSIAFNLAPESFGYFDLAASINPDIIKTQEFQALRGVAHYLSKQYDIANQYFEIPELETIAEVNLWRAASYAAMGDEKKATEIYKKSAGLADIYPYGIKRAVLAPLTLAFLNQDKPDEAMSMIDMLDTKVTATRTAEDRATVAYLKGRAQNMTGYPDEGIKNLYKASMADKMGPYGIRSELLLVKDELNREVITAAEAIQRLERLRFAWRGDDLETDIQIALGDLYIQNKEPRQGLSILKRAAKNAKTPQERRQIVRTMADAFQSLFFDDAFKDMDPLITVATYDEFKELTPVGDKGNELIDILADRLMAMNMTSRSILVLKDKIDRLGNGQHAIKTGVRVAAMELLDREPDNALKTLEKVDGMMRTYQGDDKDAFDQKIVMLKARAYADLGQAKRALFMTEGLDDTDDIVKLRVDTAWKSGEWTAVTDNLSKLLARQNLSEATTLSPEQEKLILNQAVALSLSNQYDALQRFAQRYNDVMKPSSLYKTFLIVTRPQNISNLADRDTLLGVTSEVDLFQDVLKSENKNIEP